MSVSNERFVANLARFDRSRLLKGPSNDRLEEPELASMRVKEIVVMVTGDSRGSGPIQLEGFK